MATIIADVTGSTEIGTSADDVLLGLKGDDVLIGGSGDDDIKGNEGEDRLFGGKGEDNLNGGTGDDFLSGGQGDDNLVGGDGSDKLFGGTGDDNLSGQDGLDFLTGGAGADTFILSSRDDGEAVEYLGVEAANADVITDLDFAEGDVLRLDGFSNLLTSAGIITNNVSTFDDLAALITVADSAFDHQTNSMVLTLTDDDANLHVLRLMDYSLDDFLVMA